MALAMFSGASPALLLGSASSAVHMRTATASAAMVVHPLLPARPLGGRRTCTTWRARTPRLVVTFQQDGDRGHQHLSADLEEGTLVVYQTGTWLVDNVPVGPGDPEAYRLAQVDVVQVNWTQSCEHGVIRCFDAKFNEASGEVVVNDEEVDFGPEQLVATLEEGDALPEAVVQMLHEDAVCR